MGNQGSIYIRTVHESVWLVWLNDSVGKMENQGLLSLVQLSVQIGQNRSNRFGASPILNVHFTKKKQKTFQKQEDEASHLLLQSEHYIS